MEEILFDHQNEMVTSRQRRLDGLARLLEAGMTCTAVCIIDKTLYITTNDIFAHAKGKPSGKGFRHLKVATQHFLSKAFSDQDEYSDIDQTILLQNFNGKLATYYKGQPGAPNLIDEEVRTIITELLNADSTRSFMDPNQSMSYFRQFLSKETIESTCKSKSAFFQKTLEVQQVFFRLWRDVRDYRKLKSMFRAKALDIESSCIVAVGQKDEHAEMRMLGFLLNRPHVFDYDDDTQTLIAKKPIYIGISKLCCPYCMATLNEFGRLVKLKTSLDPGLNIEIGDEQADDDVLMSAASLSSQSEEAFKDMVLREIKTFDVRGQHDLQFNNWQVPAFARLIEKNVLWQIHCIKKLKDLPKNSAEYHVYYVESKSNKPVSCRVFLNASIKHTGRGAKQEFSFHACPIEMKLDQQIFTANAIDTEKLHNACERVYIPGYQSQMHSILPSDTGTLEEKWIPLEVDKTESINRECLLANDFTERLLTAWNKLNTKVGGEVKTNMIASTSSSSVGDFFDDAEGIGKFAFDEEISSIRQESMFESIEDAEEETQETRSTNSSDPSFHNSSFESDKDDSASQSMSSERERK